MQIHLSLGATALGRPFGGLDTIAGDRAAESGQTAAVHSPRGPPQDADFIFLQQAYRASGGIAHGEEMATRLHVNGAGGYARLARWIVGRQVFSFSWHDHVWLPLFQFDRDGLFPRQGLHAVLAELIDVMDGRALAAWFALPNNALQGSSPVDMLASHGADVHQAARLQRFVAKG